MKKLRMAHTLIFLLTITTVAAREEAPELVTDRPDQTESSAVVPTGTLQMETGFLTEYDETTLTSRRSSAYNTTLLRYGLLENFELRLGMEYLGEKTRVKATETTGTATGFSPVYTGFKVKIADEEGWKPETAFLGGLVLPFTASKDFRPEFTAATVRFSFSHTLSHRLSLGYNLGAEWDGESAAPGYFYSMALGIGLTGRLGMFLEGFGLIPEAGDQVHLLDAGFTFLLSPVFQLDISGGIGLNEPAADNFISFGFSCRLPY